MSDTIIEFSICINTKHLTERALLEKLFFTFNIPTRYNTNIVIPSPFQLFPLIAANLSTDLSF